MKSIYFKKDSKEAHCVVENKTNKSRGLTIVETLVAISILVVAVLGPIVIVSKALRISFYARDQMTAFYLAQEAIEYVRNMRDMNALTKTDPADWLDGIASVDIVPDEVDESDPIKYNLVRDSSSPTGYTLTPCPLNVCPKLKINTTTKIYGDSSAIKNSIYSREISFRQVGTDDAGALQSVGVEVVMKWNQIGGEYDFRLRDILNNWKIQNTIIN